MCSCTILIWVKKWQSAQNRENRHKYPVQSIAKYMYKWKLTDRETTEKDKTTIVRNPSKMSESPWTHRKFVESRILGNILIRKLTMTSFAMTVYGQCCRLHVVGQPVVSDISVVRSCWSICSLCFVICYYACLLMYLERLLCCKYQT